MTQKLLIANRGEAASRIIRTAKRMGLGTVAVHSEADSRALHVGEADERVGIGPSQARDSYLKIDQIIRAARDTGADAVHPGYGFLSESAEFARRCREEGLVFIGPPTEAIQAMGRKTDARALAKAVGIPVAPGSEETDDVEQACRFAEALGYPVLLKPVLGGGGIGMRMLRNEEELRQNFDNVREAAALVFGDDNLYLERYLDAPRHIDVQVAADAGGLAVHLGERECSIQRRHQKLVAESPSSSLAPDLAAALREAALALVRRLKYQTIATVEMLVDGDAFYFLEMNMRLQLEHSVTEMCTEVDLVEWQIRTALGEALPARQEEIVHNGHAIECLITAESPEDDFRPEHGRLHSFLVPTGEGIRNDVGVREGDYVTPYYDPLLAKLIVHGSDRNTAIKRLQAALDAYMIDGIKNNLGLHRKIAVHPMFIGGETTTHFLQDALGLPRGY